MFRFTTSCCINHLSSASASTTSLRVAAAAAAAARPSHDFLQLIAQIQNIAKSRASSSPSAGADSSSAGACRAALQQLASSEENRGQLLRWSRDIPIDVLSHIAVAAQHAMVKPDGTFINTIFLPALVARFASTAEDAGGDPEGGDEHLMSQLSLRERNVRLLQEAILMRRLCEVGMFRETTSINGESSFSHQQHQQDRMKIQIVVSITKRITRLLSLFPAEMESFGEELQRSVDSAGAVVVRRDENNEVSAATAAVVVVVLTDKQKKRASLLVADWVAALNHVIGGLIEAAEACKSSAKVGAATTTITELADKAGGGGGGGGGVRASHLFPSLLDELQRGAARIMRVGADCFKAVRALEKRAQHQFSFLSKQELFHIVRIFRHTAMMLHSSATLLGRCSNGSTATTAAFTIRMFQVCCVPFVLHACALPLRHGIGHLRGSHHVTVLQACAKILSTISAASPLLFRSEKEEENLSPATSKKLKEQGAEMTLKHAIEMLAEASIDRFSNLRSTLQASAESSSSSSASSSSASHSSHSSRNFDTTPAAVARAALSLASLPANAACSRGVRSLLDRCFWAVAQDLIIQSESSSGSSTNNKPTPLSTVAWCELLTALRLDMMRGATSNSNHYSSLSVQQETKSGQRHRQHQQLLAYFSSVFPQVLSQALRQDISSATVVLVAVLDCRLAVTLQQAESVCAAFASSISRNQNQVVPLATLRQLSRLAVRGVQRAESAQQKQGAVGEDDDGGRLVARERESRGVRDVLNKLIGSAALTTTTMAMTMTSSSSAINLTTLHLAVDTLRNLVFLGASFSECEVLADFTAAAASTVLVLGSASRMKSSDGDDNDDAEQRRAISLLYHLTRCLCFAPIARADTALGQDAERLTALLDKRRALLQQIFTSAIIGDAMSSSATSSPSSSVSLIAQTPALWSNIGECLVRCGFQLRHQDGDGGSEVSSDLCSSWLRSALRAAALGVCREMKRGGENNDENSLVLNLLQGGGNPPISFRQQQSRVKSTASLLLADSFDEQDALLSRASLPVSPRTVFEEYVFLCCCVEQQQHPSATAAAAAPPPQLGHPAEEQQRSIFEWAALSGDPNNSTPALAPALHNTFSAALASIEPADLQNNVSSKLPFALSSRTLRLEGGKKSNVVRGAVIRKLLADMLK